jgi:hypothetical protein
VLEPLERANGGFQGVFVNRLLHDFDLLLRFFKKLSQQNAIGFSIRSVLKLFYSPLI